MNSVEKSIEFKSFSYHKENVAPDVERAFLLELHQPNKKSQHVSKKSYAPDLGNDLGRALLLELNQPQQKRKNVSTLIWPDQGHPTP